MPRTCTVCTHPQREAIDRALVSGQPVRSLVSRYVTKRGRPLGHMALYRHKDEHLPATLVKAHVAAEVAHADALLSQVRELRDRALAILDRAEEDGQLMPALAAIREARGCLELLGKLMGEIDERPQVNVLVSPEWLTLRAAILAALVPYPEAQAAVAETAQRPVTSVKTSSTMMPASAPPPTASAAETSHTARPGAGKASGSHVQPNPVAARSSSREASQAAPARKSSSATSGGRSIVASGARLSSAPTRAA